MHSKTFNLYCDESCHLENDHKPYMLLSYVSVPYNHIETLRKRFFDLKQLYNIREEIKWSEPLINQSYINNLVRMANIYDIEL